MIEFYGRLSEECIKKTQKAKNKYFALILLIFNLIVLLITSLLVIFKLMYLYKFLVLIILMAAINIFVLVVPPKSMFFRLSKRFIINNDSITQITELNLKPKTVSISKVKKVIDEEGWYYIVFSDIVTSWIIQKNLIFKGTIEEFEKLFEGKIIRKNQK